MATAYIRETASFLRWRLVPVRKLGKVRNRITRSHAAPILPPGALPFDPVRLEHLQRDGYCRAQPLDPAALDAIRALYLPRTEAVVPRHAGHPFENIARAGDFNADNPLFRFALSDEVLGAAQAYFDGAFRFDSIQVLHSFPTDGPLRASQHWHRDYGDSKSLHFVMYLSDVEDERDGPFGFVDKQTSRRVKRSPIIRRLTDDQIAAEIGHDRHEIVYGKAGTAILMDPATCYHYGSRCSRPRTAVFVTFNTDAPYTGMVEPLASSRQQAAAAARLIRPDLPGAYLDAILQA